MHLREDCWWYVPHHRVLDHGEEVSDPIQARQRAGGGVTTTKRSLRGGREVTADGRLTECDAKTDGLEVGLGVEEDL